ncbi:unnamed protein product [Vitrella brassicaformis CCMP3155]|uniref:Ribosomal protein L30 ferredoxin-like fold domain-containing protein n=2 Tax=Vitrella brassicaformis TaxID=1169539 RepID=A0A0G4EXC8_VITBC|nr:unnamed protein product [Vitrella brassicaformis CCMP3155]|eukprot:CEM03224.1 unnamed protein product [Vitrella brassicaformis CCMP3155]
MEVDEGPDLSSGPSGQLKPRREGESIKVSETVLRKRRHDLAGIAERRRKIALAKEQSVKKQRRSPIVTVQKLIKEYRNRHLDRKRQTREQRRTKSAKLKHSTAVFLAVRNGRKGGNAATRGALKGLGLTKAFTGVLVLNNLDNVARLKSVEPFIFYGPPTLSTVRQLFSKRARLHVPGRTKKEPLTDNTYVEDHLGHLGMLCVEDMVQEVFKGGERAKDVLKFLWPFQLGDLKKAEGLDARRNEYGDLREKLDDKVQSIL